MEPHSFDNPGAIQSPVDHRDFTQERLNSLASHGVPTAHKDSNQAGPMHWMPILYQGQTPSCVAHSTAWAYMYKYFLDNKKQFEVPISPRFIYALCKANDGIPQTDGTFPRVACGMLQKYGIALDSDFANNVGLPRDTYQDASLITQKAYQDAKPQGGETYISVPLDIDAMKAAIDQYGCILVCLTIDQNWWTSASGVVSWSQDDILPIRPPKTNYSGHQIAIYGYDDKFFYFANSFGSSWGDGGYAWFDPVAYKPWFNECWAITTLTPEVVQALQQGAQQVQQSGSAGIDLSWLKAAINWLEKLAAKL